MNILSKFQDKFEHKFDPRERALIMLAGVLICLFILWQFLITPALSHGSDARRGLETAERDHAIVNAGLPALSAQNGAAQSGGGARAPFDQNAVVQTARRADVSISRVQPASDGALQVWLEDAPAASVYTFLNELEARYSVSINRAQISREENGTVASQFSFSQQ